VNRLFFLAGIFVSLSLGQTPKGLLFHAPFDNDGKALKAKGDAVLYSAPSYKDEKAAMAGLGAAPAARLVVGQGRKGGGALHFAEKNGNAVFFRAAKNVNFKAGTISFWLRVDPEKELAPGYCDPLQLTDKAYNDSAVWVDFTKDEKPRHFRLGVFGVLSEWNPNNIESDKNVAFSQRLVVVQKPPFTGSEWTHVAITHNGLGTGQGVAALYLNGQLIGKSPRIRESFGWDAAKSTLRLGVSYLGWMDELMVFDRVLSETEIRQLGK
jgi:hypothetical protein